MCLSPNGSSHELSNPPSTVTLSLPRSPQLTTFLACVCCMTQMYLSLRKESKLRLGTGFHMLSHHQSSRTRISINTEHDFWMPTINTSEYSPADSFQSRSEWNVPSWCQFLQGLITAEVRCKMLKNTLHETKINHPWNNVIPTKTFLGWGHCMCCFSGRLPNHPATIWGKHCVDRNIAPGR